VVAHAFLVSFSQKFEQQEICTDEIKENRMRHNCAKSALSILLVNTKNTLFPIILYKMRCKSNFENSLVNLEKLKIEFVRRKP